MDEYYQADINELANLTNGSSSASNIRSMERQMLSSLDFKLHCGRAPMVFLNRLQRAAYTRRSDIGYEISILAMDILLLEVKFREINSAEKATAAVLASRIILWFIDKIDNYLEIWTPNLKYYGYETNPTTNLKDMVNFTIISVQNLVKQINVHIDERPNLVIKYTSRSKHNSLLQKLKDSGIMYLFNACDIEGLWKKIF